MEENNSIHIGMLVLLILIALNLLVLDIKIFSDIKTKSNEVATVSTSNPFTSPKPSQLAGEGGQPITGCPSDCLNIIEKTALQNIQQISPIEQTPIFIDQTRKSTVREFYIPLGTGNTQKFDWDNLAATEILIDPANYGKIKQAFFIASLRNPTKNGQVEAQLYNVTDKHPVWNSHVILNGPVEQTITSNQISLDNGSKLYRVQLKSTLQFQAYLDNAKIKIITE